MRQSVWILFLILIGQLLLIVFGFNQSADSQVPQHRLLVFDVKQIDELLLEKQGEQLRLQRKDGQWILTDHHQFPANSAQVDAMLAQLLALKPGWPVAQSKQATQHFQMGEKAQASIRFIHQGKELSQLVFGSSPGFKTTYAQIQGSNDIYLLPFNVFDLSVAAKKWFDPALLHAPLGTISKVELASLSIAKVADNYRLQIAGVDTQADQQDLSALFKLLAGLNYQTVESVETLAALAEQARYTIISTQNMIHYQLYVDQQQRWLLHRTDQPYCVVINQQQIEQINQLKEKLVKLKESLA
jgi:PAS domain-containing protein